MLTIEERLLVLERSSRRWRVAAVTASLCVVACVLAAAAAANNLVVVGSVRAKSFQVWDHDRGDLVLDVEDAINGNRHDIRDLESRLRTCEEHTAAAYRQSGAEKIDTQTRAAADAPIASAREQAALLAELQRLTRQVADARVAAAASAQRQEMEAWLNRPQPPRYDNTGQIADELRRLRTNMEMWNLPQH